MLPLIELRGSIPIAIGAYHLSPGLALALSVVGNIIPVVILLLLLDRITTWARTLHPRIDKWFNRFFARTYRRHSAQFEHWGSLALMLFVAVPLPMTGAWTGALLAYLFGIKFINALLSIGVGVLIAGVIVTLVSLGGLVAFRAII